MEPTNDDYSVEWSAGVRSVEINSEIAKLRSIAPVSITEVAQQQNMLAALNAELKGLSGNAPQNVDPGMPLAGVSRQKSGTLFEQWLEEAAHDDSFERPNHQAFNRDLQKLVCCFPDRDLSAATNQQRRIETAIVAAETAQQPIDAEEVPDDVLRHLDGVLRSAAAIDPDEALAHEPVFIRRLWDEYFRQRRPAIHVEAGRFVITAHQGYECLMMEDGSITWEGPVFRPGIDYDGAFRDLIYSKRCTLRVVRAIAAYKVEGHTKMLNADLVKAIDALAYQPARLGLDIADDLHSPVGPSVGARTPWQQRSRRADPLSTEIDLILEAQPDITPSALMSKLRSRINVAETCVVDVKEFAVLCTLATGETKWVRADALAQRLKRRRTVTTKTLDIGGTKGAS